MARGSLPVLSFEKYPFLRILFPFVLGILLEFHLGEQISLWLPIACGALLVGFVSIFGQKLPHLRFLGNIHFGIAFFLLFCSCGMGLYRQTQQTPSLPNRTTYPHLCVQPHENIRWNPRSVSVTADLVAVVDSFGKTSSYPATIQLYFEPSDSLCLLHQNQILLIENRLRAITPEDTFPSSPYFRSQGILATAYLPSACWSFLPDSLYRESPLSKQISRWNAVADCLIQESELRSDEAALLSAICLGNRQWLSPAQRNAFSVSGLSHLLSVSGLHIGIVAGILSLLLFPLYYYRKEKIAILLTIGGVWLYALFCGASYPAIRAAIAISFLLFGRVIGRRNYALNALFAAAFFILLFEPGALFHIGFQLSFSAVIVILLAYSPIQKQIQRLHQPFRFLTATLALSFVIWAGTSLLVIAQFQTLSWTSVGLNALITPILPIIMVCGFLFLFFAGIGVIPHGVLVILNGMLRGLNFAAFHSAPKTLLLPESIPYTPYLVALLFFLFLVGLYRYDRKKEVNA